jgi:hypothetical protein
MGTDYEYLHQWLDRVAPNSFKPGDLEFDLIRKLVIAYGETPEHGDLYYSLVRKLVSGVGATPAHGDTE